ncbi:hypothetical protein [Microbacterium sp. VKM Ac-2923]|uniref:hypothetical protein n=1 Tax=Microbacterium sp. VKM Ac-2923 TaxID=2929476 RepID=UPI001FB4AEF1|nr:hypothetical protein [Microbacterium sp. VKM Ac-2923]
MTMETDDRPTMVNELLWVREAFDLAVEGDAPPPLLDSPAAASRSLTESERARWTAAWPEVWTAVVEHAVRPHDPEAMGRLMRQDTPARERPALLALLAGPSWRDEFGDEVFDDPSYRAWDERSFASIRSALPPNWEAQPERRAVESLAGAWRRGLQKVVVLACSGTFVRSVGSTGLLVTKGDRDDDASYRRALASFAPL